MRRLFIDTNVLLYAIGAQHPHKRQCVAFLEAVTNGEVDPHASTELIPEFLFHRVRRTSPTQATEEARQVVRACRLHPFDEAVVERMIDIVAGDSVGGRDAVHVATALNAGFGHIVSLDPDLDGIASIQRLTPGQALTGRAL